MFTLQGTHWNVYWGTKSDDYMTAREVDVPWTIWDVPRVVTCNYGHVPESRNCSVCEIEF